MTSIDQNKTTISIVTLSPSSSITLIPSTPLRPFLHLHAFISTLNISEEVFLEENSPQYKALK